MVVVLSSYNGIKLLDLVATAKKKSGKVARSDSEVADKAARNKKPCCALTIHKKKPADDISTIPCKTNHLISISRAKKKKPKLSK
jgi:hypothetical protein